jgi:hypothetical protein
MNTPEQKITIRGVTYKKVDKDGEKILRRYDKKHKTWVTLRFTKNDDKEILDNVLNMASNILSN